MSLNDPTTEQASQEDALIMSDDAFADLDPSYFDELEEGAGDESQASDETDDVTDEGDTDDDETAGDEAVTEDTDADDDEDADPQGQADVSEEADDEDTEEDDTADEDAESDSDEELDDEADEDTDDQEDDKDSDDAVDYKAEYEKLMAPFKANGHEMQVKNADEVRRLMQMGANYNKKMAALKPSLKTVKLLDKHGLNEESKLSHLIDLSRGDKGAIQKLLKDSGVDPMDLDSDQESDYRPNTYNVDDREMELDEVLDSLQDTPTYQQTVDLVSNKWDDASKQIIANNPRVLEVLNDQMATGVYERVSTEVRRLQALGQLSGVSDIEAYKQIGDRLAQEGAFNDLESEKTDQNKPPEEKPVTRRTRRKKPDAKLKEKKRAASSTKTKPASTAPTDYSPLGMSDEEFEKQFDSNLQ